MSAGGWALSIILALIAAGVPSILSARSTMRVKRVEAAQAQATKDEAAREKAEIVRERAEAERTAMLEAANRVMNDTIGRMQQVHDSIVAGLHQEINRLNAQIARLEAREEADLEKLRDYEEMKRTAGRLEALVTQLSQQLRVDIPNGPTE